MKPHFTATIYSTPEESQTVEVILEYAGPDGWDAHIITPITIKATDIRTDVELCYREHFSDRLNDIFNCKNERV